MPVAGLDSFGAGMVARRVADGSWWMSIASDPRVCGTARRIGNCWDWVEERPGVVRRGTEAKAQKLSVLTVSSCRIAGAVAVFSLTAEGTPCERGRKVGSVASSAAVRRQARSLLSRPCLHALFSVECSLVGGV